MKKSGLFFGIIVAFLFAMSSTYAAVPQLINLQGKLLNASTHERLDGNYDFTFEIYNAETGGTPLWSETYNSGSKINVNKGLFSVYLGGRNALNLDFSENYWLQIYVNGEQLTPRVRIASSGYSLSSERPWNQTGNDVYNTNTGNVGIGTTSPGAKLDVSGGNIKTDTAFIGEGAYSGYAWFSHPDMTSAGQYALLQHGAGETYLNTPSGKNIHFRINNNDKMILTSGGNVGIGTATPAEKLDVQGNINASGDISGNRLCISSEDCKGSWNDVGGGWSTITDVQAADGTDWAGTTLSVTKSGGSYGTEKEYSKTYYLPTGGWVYLFNQVDGSYRLEGISRVYSDTNYLPDPPTSTEMIAEQRVFKTLWFKGSGTDYFEGPTRHLITVPIKPGSYVRLYRHISVWNEEYYTPDSASIQTKVATIFSFGTVQVI